MFGVCVTSPLYSLDQPTVTNSIDRIIDSIDSILYVCFMVSVSGERGDIHMALVDGRTYHHHQKM